MKEDLSMVEKVHMLIGLAGAKGATAEEIAEGSKLNLDDVNVALQFLTGRSNKLLVVTSGRYTLVTDECPSHKGLVS